LGTDPRCSSTIRWAGGDVGTVAGGHRPLFEHLAEVLDVFTTRRLERAGVREGSCCLAIGASAGTIACWLADRGADVIATDLDPSNLPPYPGVTVLKHNVATDPLIRNRFDLIHARLVTAHLPERRAVLDKLIDALAPDGALVLEEFEASWDGCVVDTPDPAAHRLFSTYHRAFEAVLRQAGTDLGWGRHAHRAMREAGLVDVDTEFWACAWHGGEPGCLLPFTAAGQLRDKLIAAGMTALEIDDFQALLLDPRLVIRGGMAVSTIGRKPGEPR
jgi:SAM-dependent methyltransferase